MKKNGLTFFDVDWCKNSNRYTKWTKSNAQGTIQNMLQCYIIKNVKNGKATLKKIPVKPHVSNARKNLYK